MNIHPSQPPAFMEFKTKEQPFNGSKPTSPVLAAIHFLCTPTFILYCELFTLFSEHYSANLLEQQAHAFIWLHRTLEICLIEQCWKADFAPYGLLNCTFRIAVKGVSLTKF